MNILLGSVDDFYSADLQTTTDMVQEANACGDGYLLRLGRAWGAVKVDRDLNFCFARFAGDGSLARHNRFESRRETASGDNFLKRHLPKVQLLTRD